MDNQSGSQEADFEQWLKALQGDSDANHEEGQALRAALLRGQAERSKVNPGETEVAYERLQTRMRAVGLLDPVPGASSAKNVTTFPTQRTPKKPLRALAGGWRLAAGVQ